MEAICVLVVHVPSGDVNAACKTAKTFGSVAAAIPNRPGKRNPD
jgi:hypothetical protein